MYSGRRPTRLQELGHAVRAAPARLPIAVGHQRLRHDVEQRAPRVQRGEGVLEDHLHLAAQRPELALRQRRHVQHDVLALRAEEDLARRRQASPAGCSGRSWSCRSRSRPPATGSRPSPRRSSRRPRRGRGRPRGCRKPRRIGKNFCRPVHLEERRAASRLRHRITSARRGSSSRAWSSPTTRRAPGSALSQRSRHEVGTARVERTAGRPVVGVRDGAGDGRQLACARATWMLGMERSSAWVYGCLARGRWRPPGPAPPRARGT